MPHPPCPDPGGISAAPNRTDPGGINAAPTPAPTLNRARTLDGLEAALPLGDLVEEGAGRAAALHDAQRHLVALQLLEDRRRVRQQRQRARVLANNTRYIVLIEE